MDKNEYREEVLRQLKIQNEQLKSQNEKLSQHIKNVDESFCTLGMLIFCLGIVIIIAIIWQNVQVADMANDIDIIRHNDNILSPFYKLNNFLNDINNSLDSLYEQIAYIQAYMR